MLVANLGSDFGPQFGRPFCRCFRFRFRFPVGTSSLWKQVVPFAAGREGLLVSAVGAAARCIVCFWQGDLPTATCSLVDRLGALLRRPSGKPSLASSSSWPLPSRRSATASYWPRARGASVQTEPPEVHLEPPSGGSVAQAAGQSGSCERAMDPHGVAYCSTSLPRGSSRSKTSKRGHRWGTIKALGAKKWGGEIKR